MRDQRIDITRIALQRCALVILLCSAVILFGCSGGNGEDQKGLIKGTDKFLLYIPPGAVPPNVNVEISPIQVEGRMGIQLSPSGYIYPDDKLAILVYLGTSQEPGSGSFVSVDDDGRRVILPTFETDVGYVAFVRHHSIYDFEPSLKPVQTVNAGGTSIRIWEVDFRGGSTEGWGINEMILVFEQWIERNVAPLPRETGDAYGVTFSHCRFQSQYVRIEAKTEDTALVTIAPHVPIWEQSVYMPSAKLLKGPYCSDREVKTLQDQILNHELVHVNVNSDWMPRMPALDPYQVEVPEIGNATDRDIMEVAYYGACFDQYFSKTSPILSQWHAAHANFDNSIDGKLDWSTISCECALSGLSAGQKSCRDLKGYPDTLCIEAASCTSTKTSTPTPTDTPTATLMPSPILTSSPAYTSSPTPQKTYCPCNDPSHGKPKNYASATECAVDCPSGLRCFDVQCTYPP